MKDYCLKFDEANNAETWFANGGQKLIQEYFGPYRSKSGRTAYIPESQFKDFMEHAQGIEGFDGGPAIAPHPFVWDWVGGGKEGNVVVHYYKTYAGRFEFDSDETELFELAKEAQERLDEGLIDGTYGAELDELLSVTFVVMTADGRSSEEFELADELF